MTYLIIFYGTRDPDGFGYPRVVSDVWGTAQTLDEALDSARRASANSPEADDEFSVLGGQYEPGGSDNPLFKAGKRVR